MIGPLLAVMLIGACFSGAVFSFGVLKGQHDVKSKVYVERFPSNVQRMYFGECFDDGKFVYCAKIKQ